MKAAGFQRHLIGKTLMLSRELLILGNLFRPFVNGALKVAENAFDFE